MDKDNIIYEKFVLINSNKFKGERDILESLLKNNEKYSVNDAKLIIKSYKERMI